MKDSPFELYLLSLNSNSGKKSSESKLDQVARLHGYPSAKDYPWHELTYVTVMQIIDALDSAGKSFSTCNATLSAIKGVCRQAWILEGMDGDTFAKIKGIKQKKGERLSAGQAVDTPDVDALFDVLDTDKPKDARDAAMLSLGFDLGLRREEIATIKLAQVQLKTDSIRVIGKGNKERELPLNPRSKFLLSRWFDLAKQAKELHNLKGEFLFGKVSKTGNVLNLDGVDVSTVWRVIKSVAMRSGVDFDSLPATHDMRRTRITQWLDVGDARVVQKLAGHEHIQTTMGYDRGELGEKMKDIQSKSS